MWWWLWLRSQSKVFRLRVEWLALLPGGGRQRGATEQEAGWREQAECHGHAEENWAGDILLLQKPWLSVRHGEVLRGRICPDGVTRGRQFFSQGNTPLRENSCLLPGLFFHQLWMATRLLSEASVEHPWHALTALGGLPGRKASDCHSTDLGSGPPLLPASRVFPSLWSSLYFLTKNFTGRLLRALQALKCYDSVMLIELWILALGKGLGEDTLCS